MSGGLTALAITVSNDDINMVTMLISVFNPFSLLAIITKSSANNKADITLPCNTKPSLESSSSVLKLVKYNANKRGDKEHPCLTPLDKYIGLVLDPFTDEVT